MDIDSDQGLLVVDLEHCVPSDTRHLIKSSCVYETLPTSNCQDIIQIENSVQCMNINQAIGGIPPQLTQLQSIPFHEIQVSYEQNLVTDGIPLYQTSLQTLSPSQTYSSPFLASISSGEELNIIDENGHLGPPSPRICEQTLLEHVTQPTPPASQDFPSAGSQPQDPPRFPINDYRYYKEIEEFLKFKTFPSGASETYKTYLKTRARHYMIINNELHHNRHKPKKVIMKKEDQVELLKMSHVSKPKGFHFGIKKMMTEISSTYFWRGMYEDISNHVNSCPKCRDCVDVAQQLEKERNKPQLGSFEECEEDSRDSQIHMGVQTSTSVWADVEVQVHGPFKHTVNQNEFVVTITDPTTCFLLTAPLSSTDCSAKLTDFMLKTFYTFGFPNTYLVSDKGLFDSVTTEFNSKLKHSTWKTSLLWRENADCTWVAQLIELLIRKKTETWDVEMDKFMFQFRAGSIRDAFFAPTDSTPFYSMFHRSPYIEDKENFSRKIIKKKKNPIQCTECDDIFMSKIMYRQHCRRHSLDKSKKNVTRLSDATPLQDGDTLPFEVIEENVAWAVGELKHFLMETKDARRKRGKYQRYSVEIQEHMLSYALKHGAMKAAAYFSQLMGTPVSDSTIRNLLRSSKHFQPRVKQDIARYALEYGVEKASEHYSKLLRKDVSVEVVKKFKAIYASRLKNASEKLSREKTNSHKLRSVDSLTEIEKEDLRKFASENSLHETVKYCLDKLCVGLGEDDVQNLLKSIIKEKSSIGTSSFYELQGITTPKKMDTKIQSSYNCSSTSIESHTIHPVNDVEKGPGPVSNSSNTNRCLSEENPAPHEVNVPTSVQSINSDGQSLLSHPKSNVLNSYDSDSDEEFLDSPSSSSAGISSKERKKNQSKINGKKRGKYTTLSPEIRAKIGKYAAENGSGKASKHFSEILGHDIAESTVRGLKDKYLKKVKHCEVTSLGYSPRGRPLRLGKYDEIVQECLKEMVRSGEKLTAFLVITTAKKIISKLEPGLLEENGGTIILNTTWAKSFLKRICVRNNT